jgi:hypothetical protein
MDEIHIQKKLRNKQRGPPSQNLGTLNIQEDAVFPKDERELLSYIFVAYGRGKYTLQIEDDEGMFRTAWKGALAKKKTEKGSRILFKALDQNSLEYHLDIEELTVPGQRKSKVLGNLKKNLPSAYRRKALKERKKLKNES